MSVAGSLPSGGVRVALDREGDEGAATVRYRGVVQRPEGEVAIALSIDVSTGEVRIDDDGAERIEREARAFVEQLAKQAFRLATQTPADDGGGRWPRRIQRWRGPK